MEVAVAVVAHERLVASAVAVEEADWVLRMWALKEALMAEAEEVEARDLLEEWLEVVEAEVAVMQEMMHHLVVDLVAVEHVGWKALSFWELQEAEERVRVVVEEGVQLESAREC